MKKKVYFIASAIIQIIMALNVLLSIDQIIQVLQTSAVQMYSMFPADFQERVLNLMTNAGPKFIILTSIVSIITSVVILVESIRGNLLKKKGLIITMTVLGFATSINTINTLLSLIDFIVIVSSKRKNPEDFPEKKKEIPKLEYQKSTTKEKVLAILAIVIYFAQTFTRKLCLNNFPAEAQIAITIAMYIIILVICILVFKDRLKRDIKLFKENAGAYLKFIAPRFAISYILLIVVTLISVLIAQQGISKNQQAIESAPLWFTFPAAVLWAPIVEELLFRGVFRRFIKNNIVFIIVSGTIFGLLHTIGAESNLFSTIVMALPYATLGGFFAYIYSKTENICSDILCHAFQNFIALTLSSLLTFALFIV